MATIQQIIEKVGIRVFTTNCIVGCGSMKGKVWCQKGYSTPESLSNLECFKRSIESVYVVDSIRSPYYGQAHIGYCRIGTWRLPHAQ